MTRLISLLGLLTSTGALMAQNDAVLGRAGEKEVLVEEIRPALNGLSESEIESLSRDPAALNKLVRSLVVQHLVLQQALAKKWDERPEVAERIRHAREVAITDSFLKSVSQPPESYPNEA